MDIEFELQGVCFVASRDKARRNPAKHQGVTFDLAAQAFFAGAIDLGTDEARIAALTPHLSRSGVPFDDLALVSENLALAATLGVSGEALARMLADDQDEASARS